MPPTTKHTEIIDLHYFIRLFAKNWWFIGICMTIGLAAAYAISKYTAPVYEVSTSVVIHEDQNSMASATANILQDFGFAGGQKNFANELLALSSTPLVHDAISQLDFRISYFAHERFVTRELYKTAPFVVIMDPGHPQPINTVLKLQILSNSEYILSCEAEDVEIYSFQANQTVEQRGALIFEHKGSFNSQVESDNFSFKIMLNANFDAASAETRSFSFTINRDYNIVKAYQAELEVSPPDLEATVAELKLKTTVPQKAKDFLNSLTTAYIAKQENQKRHVSIKTIEYIDNQLSVVADSLRIAEENLQRFRSGNQVIDISFQANQVYDELKALEKEKAELSIKMKYYDYIIDYFRTNQEYSDLITPSGMGIEDPLLNNLISELIQLNAEKVSFIENKQDKSPYLKKINIRIDNLENMILENIQYVKKTAQMSMSDLESRIAQLSREINKLPQTERQLLGMERKFNLNDAIYTYLLEKRAEAEIAKASYQANAEVLEPADIKGEKPVAPKKKVNYLAGLMLGFILPVVLLRTRDLTRTKFGTKDEVMSLDVPLLGIVYKNNKRTETVVKDFPKSHMAEAFRKMRIQLSYFLPGDDSKVIAISSTISQEGKSFTSLNLALSLAAAEYKTILLGFDLRKPKLYSGLSLNDKKPGLSDYLSKQCELDDMVQSSASDNLDVIWAGSVPPNPAELIASGRTDELLAHLRNSYDYIIIDTAPIGILSDGLMLLNKADLKVYMTRLQTTPIKEAQHTIDELKEQKTENLALIVNDIPLKKKGQYGYGYYEMTFSKK